MIKISIIVPVYNTERFLKMCLDSILNQSLKDIEVILIDDGSKDNSLEFCKEYQKRDYRVKLFSIKNSGSAVARNIGLKHALGEYIGFVDSDDWIETDMFEILYTQAKETNSKIVGCNFVRNFTDIEVKNIYKDYSSGYYSKEKIKQVIFPNLICSNRLTIEAPYTIVTKIFSRELLVENNISFVDSLLGGQDFVFSITCLIYANSIFLMNEEYLYHYRYNTLSRTNTYMVNAWEIYKSTNQYFKEITKKYKDYDFSKQVDLDLLRGAMSAISYEMKKGNNDNPIIRYRKIKNICEYLQENGNFHTVDYRTMDIARKITIYCIRKRKILILLLLGYLKKFLKR